MNCDRCGNEIEEGQERKICLAGAERSYQFTLCRSCGEAIQNAARVNVLGRNIGARELREMARRMPERGVENTAAPRGRPTPWDREIRFDEGRHDLEWLRKHGHLVRARAETPGQTTGRVPK